MTQLLEGKLEEGPVSSVFAFSVKAGRHDIIVLMKNQEVVCLHM